MAYGAYTRTWNTPTGRYFDRESQTELGSLVVKWDYNYVALTSNTKNGFSTPMWKSVIRNGGDATNPYSVTRRLIRYYPGFIRAAKPKTYFQPTRVVNETAFYEGTGFHTATVPSSFDSFQMTLDEAELENLLRAAILKKVNEDMMKLQGLVVLGELRKTLAMVRNPAKLLLDRTAFYIKQLKKRSRGVQLSNVQTRRRILTETYLEYTYGVQPLVSDSIDAMKAVAQWQAESEGIERRSRVRKRAERVFQMSPTKTNYDFSFVSLPRCVITRWDTQLSRISYVVGLSGSTVKSKTANPQRLAELAGFSLAQFVPTAWELLPWSFLVDYFTNVGDVLSSWATDTSRVAWVSRSVRRSRISHYATEVDPKQAATYLWVIQDDDNGAGGHEAELLTFSRSKVTLEMPSLEINLIPKPLQGLNMAALWWSMDPIKPYYKPTPPVRRFR